MQHFYDGQIRRYITQIVRLVSNFSYKDGAGEIKQVPVMYGDLTRQVANIIKENSENKLPSVPRMAVYITGLEMDRSRTSDGQFVSKMQITERDYDDTNSQYLDTQGKNYTVERIMPSPYNLSVNVDIWTSNTDQKLQILEQILMLFNPSLEIQTTDNYIDWTSLSVVNLEGITFSNRSIPVGVDSEIDVATLEFQTPIWISAPVKVKRMGVIQTIITSIFNEQTGDIELDLSRPQLYAYQDPNRVGAVERSSNRRSETDLATNVVATTIHNYSILLDGSFAQIINKGTVGNTNWYELLEMLPGDYLPDISRIYFTKLDIDAVITGTITVNELDNTKLIINWDTDTFPTDTVISGPTGARTGIDYIIDPSRTNPTDLKSVGTRILVLGDIGNANNTDGADAWKNSNGTSLIAGENDIIEWDGSSWTVIFDASSNSNITYVTNLNTFKQYYWDGEDWLLSIFGEYPRGTWRINLEG